MSNPYKASKKQQEHYRKEMVALTNILFLFYEDMSFEQIGELTKLHPNTLRNLWGGITKYPQFLTMQKLANGAGLSFSSDCKLTVKQ